MEKKKDNPCEGCDLCCKYVALEFDTPEDKEDYEQIIWFLLHQDVWVFIDHDDSWNIQFNTSCKKLDEKGWCNYYEKRPAICRDYESDGCEKYGEGKSHKVLFKNVEEFELWLKGNQIDLDNLN